MKLQKDMDSLRETKIESLITETKSKRKLSIKNVIQYSVGSLIFLGGLGFTLNYINSKFENPENEFMWGLGISSAIGIFVGLNQKTNYYLQDFGYQIENIITQSKKLKEYKNIEKLVH